ncbi:aceric acid hydrolase [Roseimarinus sediminis]|uniref:aceric acid hydrolase n=1 Tax=Roseimarinus sediminis TaxID=1610899 RepID=UPI003D1EDA5E
MKRIAIIISVLTAGFCSLNAQERSLVNTSESPFAKLSGVNVGEAAWTDGFWAERYEVCMHSMVPHMMDQYLDDSVSHAFLNFEIAAGLKDGEHFGPPFHDGDFYKIFEGLVMDYAATRDKNINDRMDRMIEVITASQRSDGYLHTPVAIATRMHPEKKHEFSERLDFETYNMGHLMTLATLHHRVTGQENLLNIAKASADFLYKYYKAYPGKLADNAICPSHYMGVTELYRSTGDEKYKELAKGLIDIRAMVKEGTDHNQDRIPFKQQTTAMGHAVRANYLYAGAADVYAETGDDSVMHALEQIWNDVSSNKLYITGATGALYDGVSPNGTTYDQPSIQRVHQAYGRPYELPNLTAHNESCANIGNLLWNWRMFAISGEARYIDVLEQVAYNSLLAGVSLDGKGYFYTNPLSVHHEHGLSDSLRWSKTREPYISYCNCCPPNTIRTIAQMQDYAYALSDKGLWINLYGSSELTSTMKNGSTLSLKQESNYPWDGNVSIVLNECPSQSFSIFVRIPGWADAATLKVNGSTITKLAQAGTYYEIERSWSKGDQIAIEFPMEVKLMTANPLVEATRNQVAVMRGPVVYCLESADVPKNYQLTDIVLTAGKPMKAKAANIAGSKMYVIEGSAWALQNEKTAEQLYHPLKADRKKTKIQLVPYYAWGNRGKGDMSVWLPFSY